MGRTATSGYRVAATKLIVLGIFCLFLFFFAFGTNKVVQEGFSQPSFLLIILLSAGAAMTAGWRRLSVAALHLIQHVVSDSNKYHWAETQTHTGCSDSLPAPHHPSLHPMSPLDK